MRHSVFALIPMLAVVPGYNDGAAEAAVIYQPIEAEHPYQWLLETGGETDTTGSKGGKGGGQQAFYLRKKRKWKNKKLD